MGEVLNSAAALSSTERFSDFQLIFWFSMVQALLFRFTLAALVAIFSQTLAKNQLCAHHQTTGKAVGQNVSGAFSREPQRWWGPNTELKVSAYWQMNAKAQTRHCLLSYFNQKSYNAFLLCSQPCIKILLKQNVLVESSG